LSPSGSLLVRTPLALLAVLAAMTPAYAQSSPEEQARGLLDDGRTYRREGKPKQALDNFQTIVSGFPNTSLVDDALLEIGRYHLEVERDGGRAREAFEQVAKRFPQSDGAPGAYYHLGLMTLQGAGTLAEIDDAVAQFTRVQRLYPRSEWVPRALHATALAQRRASRLPDAVEAARRASLEHPTSDAAAAAQYQVGHLLALQGEPQQAMEEFQQVRNRYPNSEWAGPARDRITALYRLHGGARPAFSLDAAYAIGAGDILKDVRAILMGPTRAMHIASDKAKSAVTYDAQGALGASVSGEDLRSLSLTPSGELVVTSSRAVRVGPKDIRTFSTPGDKPGVPEPLEKLEAAVVTPGGAVLVADGKRKKVLRFDQKSQYQAPFPDSRERQVSRMVVDGEGAIVLLDRDLKTVEIVDEAGKPLRKLAARGAGYELRKPVDMAVDPFRNLYVAEEDVGVLVFAPDGRLLTTITSAELRKPSALTLDPSGAVLVYDEKSQRILRYR
jgi:TolA-binding protein